MPQQTQIDSAKAVTSKPTKKISSPSKLAQNGSTSRNLLEPQKNFAFGSSTPRELSHIVKVTRHSRLIDANNVEKKSTGHDHNLSYYMRQARSITPGDAVGRSKCWAFGSSTPREFSHLNRLKADQRVYDAKRTEDGAKFPDSKSAITLTEKSVAGQKLEVERRPRQSINTKKESHPQKISKPSHLSDDAASEPDFVQDRENVDFRRDFRFPAGNTSEIQQKQVDHISNNSSKDNTSTTKSSNPSINKTTTAKVEPPLPAATKTTAVTPKMPEEGSKRADTETSTKTTNNDIVSPHHGDATADNQKKLIAPNIVDVIEDTPNTDKKENVLSKDYSINENPSDGVNHTTIGNLKIEAVNEPAKTPAATSAHQFGYPNEGRMKESNSDSSVIIPTASNETEHTKEAIPSETKQHQTDEQPNRNENS